MQGAVLKSGLLAALVLLGFGPAAEGQSVAPVPVLRNVDQNGVNLASPDITIVEPTVGIGDPGAGGLFFQRQRHAIALDLEFGAPSHSPHVSWVGSNFYGYLTGDLGGVNPTVAVVAGTSYVTGHDGSSLALVGGKWVFTMDDGTKATYDPALYNSVPMWGVEAPGVVDFSKTLYGWITKLEKPDGEVIDWHYVDIAPVSGFFHAFRLQSVTNNLAYQIHFKYVRDDLPDDAALADAMRLQKVTAIDNAIYACGITAYSCNDSTGANWPYLVYGGASSTVRTVTDRLGNATTFTYSQPSPPTAAYFLTGVQSPASAGVNDVSISSIVPAAYPYPSSLGITIGGATWGYSYDYINSNTDARTVVTGPNGYSRTIIRASLQNEITSDTVNGYAVSYQYSAPSSQPFAPPGKLTKVTYPDGRFTEYTYDARRNVTQVREVAKPGSGLADVYSYASFPETGIVTCVNAKTCNQPIWVTTSGPFSSSPSSLPKTDFAYETLPGPTFGMLLSETRPAPGSGPYAAIRPQARYAYDATGGIVRGVSVKSCRTTATCAGTADETVVETTYNTKRLPSLVVTRAGNNTTAFSATNTRVATTYTSQGDVESVDGPLSGAFDTAWTFYDMMRRPRVTVAPDPDGAGTLVYRASRTTYDADGQPVMAEQGSVTSPANCSAANNFCATTMTVLAKSTVEYDAYGRKTRENLINISTGAPETVKQYAYDAASRVECVATRMNSAIYGSLPAACTQSTAGSFGADPILRTTYTANGDPWVVQSGYGTTLVRNERTLTYLVPGQVSTLKDAANNLTTYEYDGFNRLTKLRYPVATTGGNASSTTDYEQYVYDAAGNNTSERRRDGLMIANTYDALNRLRLIDKPGVELDVTNAYDNFDHLITASQTGSSVTWAYDALGRVTSEAQALGTVSYTYDTAGRRTQLTYPGAGFFANYQYFDDGRLKLIGLNGATTGTGVLATYYDDQLGRRASMCRGTGTTSSCASVARTTYSYDAVSRLSGRSHDLVTGGAANDASWTLAYSPASQLSSRVASSALYEWPYSAAFTDAYVANGLNQYTTVAGASLTYDARGNATNDTTKAYTYDSSNMLMSASNGAALTYDPTGRLLSIAQGGVTTKFLYDGTRLISEYNGSNALLRRYVHGDGVDDPIVWYDSSGTANKRNLFKDERGSVITVDTGSAVTSLKYDEYGNATVTGSATPRFQYTGQTWLPELGLNYYKARIYNPDLGRFMQTDPIGTIDQTNLYAYAGNDPVYQSDPTGLMGATVDRIEIYGYGRWGVDTIGCSYGACDSILGGVSGIPLVLGPMVGPDLNLPIFDNRRGGGRKGGDGKGERKYGDKTPNQEKEDKRSTPHPKPGFKWVPNPQTGKPDMKPWPEDIRKGGDGSGVHPNSLGDIKPPTSNNSDSTDWLGAAGSIALGGIIGGAAAACVAAEPCGAFLAGGIAIFSFSF